VLYVGEVSSKAYFIWSMLSVSVLADCPPVAEKRLSLTRNAMVRYELKTPYRDGTTHVLFEPLDFISKLAALIPKPRVNLTRYHGVFAPDSQYRAQITPSKRAKGGKKMASNDDPDQLPEKGRASMRWAQRLNLENSVECQKDV
jgi:hypothetical protein